MDITTSVQVISEVSAKVPLTASNTYTTSLLQDATLAVEHHTLLETIIQFITNLF